MANAADAQTSAAAAKQLQNTSAADPNATTKPEQGFAVPDSPAFTFLGASPTKVSRPGTARALGLALANGVDSLGHAQQGLAVDFKPWALVPRIRITPDRYRTSTWWYALANTQLSLGTLRASGDTASTDAAVGIRALFRDSGDPMQSASFHAIDAALQAACMDAAGDAGPKNDSAGTDPLLACYGPKLRAARRAWSAAHWNSTYFAVGAGGGMRLRGSQFSSAVYSGIAGWAAGGFALDSAKTQLAWQARYDDRRAITTRDTARRSVSGGVRLVRGQATFNGFAEVVGNRSFGAADKAVHPTWSAGVEFLATQGLWISTGFGDTYAGRTAKSRSVVLVNVRWTFSDQSTLAPSQP